MNNRLALLTLLLLAAGTSLSATQEQFTSAHLNTLLQQGIAQESILGVDENGVPRVCGTGIQNAASLVFGNTNSTSNILPAGMRSWECIPNVIRNDGIETFRIETDVNGPVTRVTFQLITNRLISASGTNLLTLRDDGLNGDRVAGDYIFTSEPIRYRIQATMPAYQGDTTNSVPGAYMMGAGWIYALETNNTTKQFLVPPMVGVLNSNILPVSIVMLASNIQASTHFINIYATNRETQKTLRNGVGVYILDIALMVYSVLPDAFDFLSLFSTDHLEFLPSTTVANYNGGLNIQTRIIFSGTGRSYLNPGFAYGSTNRLQGINVFDNLNRGIESSLISFHEYMHLWSAHTSTTLGLTSDGSHYRTYSAAESVVGGFFASYLTNGSLTYLRRDCLSYTQAPAIDKYMMGLVSTSSVPIIRVTTNFTSINCGNYEYLSNCLPVTISNIVYAHGVRTPGPATAQRDFSICFMAGSYQRFLNATEMTFYDLLADFYTRPLPPGVVPGLDEGYVPITKYVGEGVTWSSKGLGLIRPTFTNMQWATGNFRVDGTGYPGYNYRLLASTNLTSWTQVTNKLAGTNGSFALQDGSQPRPTARWYKVATP